MVTSAPRKKWRLWAFRGVALAGALVAALFVIEAALHVAWRSPRLRVAVDSIQNDPRIGIVHVPNFKGILNTPDFRIHLNYNSKGLRDVERAYDKPPGVFRILAIGDSFVEGYGVEYDQLFLTAAEKELQSSSPRPVEIIKAGVGGWGPVQELKFLEREGFRYHPDLVLFNFYVGNDFRDAESPDDYVAWNGIRVERRIAETMTPFRAFRIAIRKKIYLYSWTVEALRGLGMSAGQRYAEDLGILRMCDPNVPVPTETVRGLIKQCREECAAKDIRLAYVVLTHRTQVESERQKTTIKKFKLNEENLDFNRPSTLLADILREQGIPYFDFTPILRGAARGGKAVGFPADSHYNPAIHALLGHELTGWLVPQVQSK